MNKRGFTLVELLAVIVILGFLALIANSSVTNVVKNSKSDLYAAQIELIKSAAQIWGEENIDKIPDDGMCSYLTLGDLESYGLFEEKVINPKTNKEFNNDMKIKITSKVLESGLLKTTYEVDPQSVKNCSDLYPPICSLVSDNDSNGKISRGDKLVCKVKNEMLQGYEDGYPFYVLNDNSNEVDLILEVNLCLDGTLAYDNPYCSSSWYSNDASSLIGPVDSMNYLYNATKDWHNISNTNISFDDLKYGYVKTNNYDTIIYSSNNEVVATYTNLKARLPYETEINSDSFLNLNLNSDLGILGYWLFNSYQGNDTDAKFQSPIGETQNSNTNNTVGIGIRPIITILKKDIE